MFDNIICVDLFIYNKVKSIMEETGQPKKVWFIPNSVDTKKFRFSPIEKTNKIKVLCVGRLTAERGLNFLIDFINNIPDYVSFVLVDASSNHISRTVKGKLNFDKLSFFENISNDRLPEFYQNADVVLNPVKVPGISRITLEAMACGRPVIMFDIGDRTPVVNKKTGFVIKEDLGELISLLDQVNKNREDLIDISYSARKAVELEYDNGVILKRIESIYNSFK